MSHDRALAVRLLYLADAADAFASGRISVGELAAETREAREALAAYWDNPKGAPVIVLHPGKVAVLLNGGGVVWLEPLAPLPATTASLPYVPRRCQSCGALEAERPEAEGSPCHLCNGRMTTGGI